MPNRDGVTVRNVLVSPRLILFRWKPGFDLVTRFQPLRFSFKSAAKYRAGLSVDSLLFGDFFFFFVKSKWLSDIKPVLYVPCFFQWSFVYIFLKFLLFEIFECRRLHLSKNIFIVDIRVLFFNKNLLSMILVLINIIYYLKIKKFFWLYYSYSGKFMYLIMLKVRCWRLFVIKIIIT